MSKRKKESAYENIHQNFLFINRSISNALEVYSKHNTITGSAREQMWMEFFESIIPKKYTLARNVLIIDSNENVSNEVDIAVFDEQYTPYVFQHKDMKYIPIEAVSVVIQCKSKTMDSKQLIEWAKNIDKLEPKRTGITRVMNGYAIGITNDVQKRTRPIKILAGTKIYSDKKEFEKSIEKLEGAFDFVIQKCGEMLEVRLINDDKPLGFWEERLNRFNGEDEQKQGDNQSKYLKLFQLSKEKKVDEKKNKEKKENDLELIRKKMELEKNHPELKFDDNLCLTNTMKDLEIEGNPLLTLNLQLNQLLMLLNNPMLFPHFAYAERFREKLQESNKKSQSTKDKKGDQK